MNPWRMCVLFGVLANLFSGTLSPALAQEGLISLDDLLSTMQTPYPGGGRSSQWCACRSVGTSPHIGVDLSRGGRTTTSVSLNHTKVVKKQFLGASCGWSVTLEDQGGAQWRYLHLDQPTALKIGQVLKPGDPVGVHKSYPTKACGTGIHLHLERRTPGAFADKPQFKDCGRGLAACYYNPESVLGLEQVPPVPMQAEYSPWQVPLQDAHTCPVSEDSLEPTNAKEFWNHATVVAADDQTEGAALTGLGLKWIEAPAVRSHCPQHGQRGFYISVTLKQNPLALVQGWQLVWIRGVDPLSDTQSLEDQMTVLQGGDLMRLSGATGVQASDSLGISPEDQVWVPQGAPLALMVYTTRGEKLIKLFEAPRL